MASIRTAVKGDIPVTSSEASQETASKRAAANAIDDARRAGLLAGDKTEHLSFRVPPALLEEARRQSGITSPTELGIAALALLALPDPVSAFMKNARGALGDIPPIDP